MGQLWQEFAKLMTSSSGLRWAFFAEGLSLLLAGGGGDLGYVLVGTKISLGYDLVAVNFSQNPMVTPWYSSLKVVTNWFGYDFAWLPSDLSASRIAINFTSVYSGARVGRPQNFFRLRLSSS